MFFDLIVKALLPKQNRFLTYLDAIARNMAVGADCFAEFREAKDVEDFHRISKQLRRIEHEGDEIAHVLYEELDKTFVTPIDREDLHALTSALDDVLDIMEACAGRIVIYRLEKLTEPMREMVRLSQASAHEVAACIALLMDANKHHELQMHFIRVNSLENEGDIVYRKELGYLFAEVKDPIELIRQKEILDALERSIDACEDVVDLIRSVVVKNG